MKVGGSSYRTIWLHQDGESVCIIDQTRLPHEFAVARLTSIEDACAAIRSMQVRGAPLIGATAAYGLCLGLLRDPAQGAIDAACRQLLATRPTAVNLRWALHEMRSALARAEPAERVAVAYARAAQICDDDVDVCRAIGERGLPLVERAWKAKGGSGAVDVLTHCNAGWLATVDWGTALSPIYLAHDLGIPVHVWVDETRPRNQGAGLTAWELGQHGVAHTVIPDNAAAHVMRSGRVDLCITGSDRTTRRGDVCNKIGTYPKALAARDNGVPFYVAVPHSSIDWELSDSDDIPIEERDPREVTHVTGRTENGSIVSVALTPEGSAAANFAFDITPARLVTALVTERGICPASEKGLADLYDRS